MFLKSVFFVCLVAFSITCGATDSSAPTGRLEGHLSVVFLKGVDTGDEVSRQTVAAGSYAEYPLIVLTADRKQQVARLIPDKSGHYRVALPPGDYVLDVRRGANGRPLGHLRAEPHPFKIVPNQTVRVDMDVDTGVR